MAGKNSIGSMLLVAGLIFGLIGSAGLVLDVGLGQGVDIIQGDSANYTAATNTSFGGTVDFSERLVVIFTVLTLAIAGGALGVSRKNPKALNQLINWYPVAGAAVALVSFSTIMSQLYSGDYDVTAHTDALNFVHFAVFGWLLQAVGKVMGAKEPSN